MRKQEQVFHLGNAALFLGESCVLLVPEVDGIRPALLEFLYDLSLKIKVKFGFVEIEKQTKQELRKN